MNNKKQIGLSNPTERCNSNFSKTGNSDKFTLIELMTVIAIISILAALLLPVLNRAKRFTKEAACMSNMHSMSAGLQTYALENDRRYPQIGGVRNSTYQLSGAVAFFNGSKPGYDYLTLDWMTCPLAPVPPTTIDRLSKYTGVHELTYRQYWVTKGANEGYSIGGLGLEIQQMRPDGGFYDTEWIRANVVSWMQSAARNWTYIRPGGIMWKLGDPFYYTSQKKWYQILIQDVFQGGTNSHKSDKYDAWYTPWDVNSNNPSSYGGIPPRRWVGRYKDPRGGVWDWIPASEGNFCRQDGSVKKYMRGGYHYWVPSHAQDVNFPDFNGSFPKAEEVFPH